MDLMQEDIDAMKEDISFIKENVNELKKHQIVIEKHIKDVKKEQKLMQHNVTKISLRRESIQKDVELSNTVSNLPCLIRVLPTS